MPPDAPAHSLPAFGALPLTGITRDLMDDWWRSLRRERPDRATGNAHVYVLLRTILGTAVKQGRLAANPYQGERVKQQQHRPALNPATPQKLDTIAANMSDRLALAVHLAAHCALRFGGLVELWRRDVDLSGDLPAAAAATAATGGA